MIFPPRRLALRAVLSLFIAVTLAPLGGAVLADEAKQVVIKDFAFSPKTLTITPGTTVTWVNQDNEIHQLATKSKAFHSAALDAKDSYSFTFKDVGSFEYFCALHPQMIGTIIVK